MEGSITKKYLSCFFLAWGLAGVAFFWLSNHSSFLTYSGALTLVAEVFLDICGFTVAFILYKKTKKQHFLWVGIGLVFAVLADGIYNLNFNILGLSGEGLADLLFEVPFTVFLGCLTFAAFCFIRGKFSFLDKYGVSIILLISLVGVFVFLLSFAIAFQESYSLLEKNAWLLLLITHISQTVFEIISYVLVIVCLAISIRKEQWIFFSGYLSLLSADLGIRVDYVAQTIDQSSPLEYLWVTGLFLMFLGLYLESHRNNVAERELPDSHDLNSTQAIIALVLVAFSGLLILSMGAILLWRSGSGQYTDFLKDLPGILLIVSLCSVQLSFFFSKKLAIILLDVYKVASTDIVIDDSAEQKVRALSAEGEKSSVKEFYDLKRIIVSSRAKLVQMLKTEKTISESSCQLAHELRTPLLSIRGFSKGIERIAEDLGEDNLAGESKRKLVSAQARIIEELDAITCVMDNFLDSMRSHFFNEKRFCLFCVDDMVIESISRYPYVSEYERSLVNYHSQGTSYNLWGERALLIHVMFNLIKNALREIMIVQRGEVSIGLSISNQKKRIIVKDTAGTMNRSKHGRLFDEFFTCSPDGHGIGLGFCKRAVESTGGKIICKYVENEYTEFTLEFCS